jgi:elongator complex protein 6
MGFGPGVLCSDSFKAILQHAHSCIITLAVDEPLIAAQSSPLEAEHAALALSLAHEAELTIGLRMLDTGVARDVSGVLRIIGGGQAKRPSLEDRELLYFVGADGSVRTFERGQAS